MPELKEEQLAEFERIINLPRKERLQMGLKNNKDIQEYFDISDPYFYKLKQKMNGGGSGDEKEDLIQKAIEGLLKGANRGSPAASKNLLEYLGEMRKDRENGDKYELSASDYIRIGREVWEGLRKEYSECGGCCSLCGISQALCNEPCVVAEPEHEQDREMAAVGLPS